QNIIAAEGSIWVSNYDANTVTRIDPATNAVASHLIVPAGNVVLGDGVVWACVPWEKVLLKILPAP
ncbi:MAG: YncE family protein, partial [Vicinamibacterales bacterium]